MAKQLTFDLPVRASRSRGDYFVSEANRLAVARLDAPKNWPNGKLVLVGDEGAGKSHLAHVWAEDHGAEVMVPADLLARDIIEVDTPCVLEIDDRRAMTGDEEESLFHFHNHLASQRLPLLIVARKAPSRWKITLPDLNSRLEAADVVRIDAPDDALLSALLLKLFSDRQIQVPPNLIAWMLPRIDRSFRAAQEAVAALDAAALAEKRPITRDLARRVLDNPPK